MARVAPEKRYRHRLPRQQMTSNLDEVVMGEATLLQTLRYQALQRAIGEMMAARETMYLQENGKYDPLDKVIQECIQKLKDNM